MALIDLEKIKSAVMDITESKYFPIQCLAGSVLLVGLTNDILWLLLGLAGFILFLFRNK